MKSELDVLAKEVADDQAAIDGDEEDTRTRVIRMGKNLRQMQKAQKKEQADTGQTWKDFVEDQKRRRATFPAESPCRYYMLISRYPSAYKTGMSIKEAYRHAGLWKKNGGNPPPKLKKTIKARPLVTIGAAAGKLERKIEKLTERNFHEVSEEEGWTEDEILGAMDCITLLRQSCNLMLRKLRELHEKSVLT